MSIEPDVTPALDLRDRANDDATHRLFPLPFTPFEYYYYLEDRPDYASSFPVRLESLGPLDREALAQAFQLTHARHPFLSARIECDRRGWPTWTAGEIPEIQWTTEPCGMSLGTAASGGVRMRISQMDDRIDWLFDFHHCAVDGMGAFLFISDLFVAYAHLSTSAPGPLPWRKLDPERLRDRDGHQLFNRGVKLVDLVRLARVTLPLNYRRASIVSDHATTPIDTSAPCVAPNDLVHHLTEFETAELSRVAGKLEVMLNDLFVRDYFLMFTEWNRGTSEARRQIRILVPTNLRRREDYRMPATNVFSFSFLSRWARDCQDRVTLLASVHDELAEIKQQKRGLYFEAGLRLFCIWPRLLRWSLGRDWPFATAIFSNLGTGLDNVPLPDSDGHKLCGDLVFERGSGAAPIRPDTRVSFAVHAYAGRLAVCARSDPRVFSADQQRAILDAYIERLRTTIRMES